MAMNRSFIAPTFGPNWASRRGVSIRAWADHVGADEVGICTARDLGAALPITRHAEPHTTNSYARWLQRRLDRVRKRCRRLSKRRGRPEDRAANARRT